MSRAVLLVAAMLLAVTVFSGSTWGAGSGGALVIVGYKPGDAKAAQLAIQAAGGHVERSSAELGFSVASTSDKDTFLRLMAANPVVQYTEDDDATAMMGAQWNGAQWNAVQWNGAQWNGAQWNGAQWNGAQWNGAQWNMAGWSDAQRQAAAWTFQHYRANNPGYRYDTATSDPGLAWQWSDWATRATNGWATTTGSNGAKLCALDSGVAFDHPDLAPNMWTGPAGEHGLNVLDPALPPYDDAGHGTHVAGIAAGRVGNAYGVAGIANVQIIAVKVLDSTGNGLEDELAIGLAYCATQGAQVAMMALGVTQPGPTLDRALQYAVDHDVLLLASAGNGACSGCVAYPARDPRVLAVTAVDGQGKLAPFASTGPEVELAAPGVDVLGPLPGNAFAFGSGTSQAVAMAAGAASLVRDAHPDLTARQTRDILASTAKSLSPSNAGALTGSGLPTVDAALVAAAA